MSHFYTDEEIMQNACDLATNGVDTGSGPFGCIIKDENGEIISCGVNLVTINNDPTQHAEIVAIRNACKKLNTFQLKGKTLYTSCEPCPMCLSAIYWARIDCVFYANTRLDAQNIGFDDHFIYEELNKDVDDRKMKMTQLCGEYAKTSFQKWTNKKNKTEY